MNSFVSANKSNLECNDICPSLNERLGSTPIRIGVWDNGILSWEYPLKNDFYQMNNELFSIASMSCSTEYEIINIQVINKKALSKQVKIIVQYDSVFEKNSLAFYSPNENAIIHFSDDTVTMIGGILNGKGMCQYCIQENNFASTSQLLRNLECGSLPMSWLAKGDISSTFTLETKLTSGEINEGKIWTFHSTSTELVREMKNEMILL
ncbi:MULTISPECIES: hypothetical protein [Bacillus]|uniref:hypothetical protein n=1 Tax=Bacillus TaxID=1386 RepID=UPI0003100F87|nr:MULTISPECIES: hypothetical protein [Bacillus]